MHDALIPGSSEVAALIRGKEWASHRLGSIENWPASLRIALTTCLAARSPMQIWWGASAFTFYNDAFVPWLGAQHPDALGRRGRDIYGPRWEALQNAIQRLFVENRALECEGLILLPLFDGVDIAGVLSTFADDHVGVDLLRAEPVAADRSPRILIVEDDDTSARTTQDTLEAFGYIVAIAHDGPIALEVAREFRPDAALIDLGLPVIDGWEVARRLREKHVDLPIVAMTGMTGEEVRQQSQRAGFVEHFCKPVDFHSLHRCLSTISASRYHR
jgi:CheY-like chemotaxis protein